MTLLIALLLIGVLMVAIGARETHRNEDSAAVLAGIGVICVLVSFVLLIPSAKAADATPPAEARSEVYTIIKYEVLQQAAALIQAQNAEIERLRAALLKASQPKECI